MKKYLDYIGTPNETIQIKKMDSKKTLMIEVDYAYPNLKRASWYVNKKQYFSFLKNGNKDIIINYFEREELDRILEIILERSKVLEEIYGI